MSLDDLGPHIEKFAGNDGNKSNKNAQCSVPDARANKKHLITLTVMTVEDDDNVEILDAAEVREKSHEFAEILHGTLMHYLGTATTPFDVKTNLEIASRDTVIRLRHPSGGNDRLNAAEAFLKNQGDDMDFTVFYFVNAKDASSAPLYVVDSDHSRAVHWEGRGIIYHNGEADGLEQTASLLLNQIEKGQQSMKMKEMFRFKAGLDCDDGEMFEYIKYFEQEHFFAILAPLLMPLIMPMILGMKKEIVRYRELTKAKIKID